MNVSISEIFGRVNSEGNVAILYVEDGSAVTRLDVDGVYPVGSDLGTRYDHAAGIILSRTDAERLGIDIE
ncbi:hypothetical protein GUO57_004335 [Salmonella enterica]|uniref:hypothetical protein n=1 Tax=Salmonella enterica TaxID=28901 RepID=UPI0009AE7191|nr:hypothetical protein [Salmonella enterica]ECI0026456.1 hypothetical protein [Salmonella enterica subsp. enterica serovar Litchfield]ECV5716230.1 hypothetical protein [Salmonella enterica subsp. enterica serovar Oranienburg]EEA7036146.1 hypothetical protein [Salmonella enterica subsp. enterica serovar Newport]EAN2420134.1 hypothetical protein [Salmonella enterica]EAT2607832.1 hypothetical protein [Salmonella enterica]